MSGIHAQNGRKGKIGTCRRRTAGHPDPSIIPPSAPPSIPWSGEGMSMKIVDVDVYTVDPSKGGTPNSVEYPDIWTFVRVRTDEAVIP
jgi:hypothetical protein